MACSLCRLPFTPSNLSNSPRWPPPDVLSKEQLRYMKYATAIGPYIPGLVADLVFMDANGFMGDNTIVITNIAWEFGGRTFVAMHPHCVTLFRHHAGLQGDDSDTILEISLLEKFLGNPMGGANAGRLPHMDYAYDAVLGDGGQHVDLNAFWSAGTGDGLHNFDWLEWKRLGLEWTAARPDVFPRFHPTLTPTRLASIRFPTTETSDALTTLPLDVLRLLLEHPALSDASFARVLGTCSTLRAHALTTFQPLTRARVVALGWALAVPAEYAAFVKRQRAQGKAQTKTSASASAQSKPLDEDSAALAQLPMAHATHSPAYGDWLLYLSQVHRTPAMRARRWLWTLAVRLADIRAVRRATSEWAEVDAEGEGGATNLKKVRSKAWARYAKDTTLLIETGKMMRAPPGFPRSFRW